MRTIWKYELELTDQQMVNMPKNPKILSAQLQGSTLCMWALVDPNERKTARCICTYGTGHSVDHWLDKKGRFIDTIQIHGGKLIFHVFDGGDYE